MSTVPECAHAVIVECRRDPDGSVWGRCESCGDDTFAIYDAIYDKHVEKHGQHRCSLIRMAEGETYKDALAGSLNGTDCGCESCRALRGES